MRKPFRPVESSTNLERLILCQVGISVSLPDTLVYLLYRYPLPRIYQVRHYNVLSVTKTPYWRPLSYHASSLNLTRIRDIYPEISRKFKARSFHPNSVFTIRHAITEITVCGVGCGEAFPFKERCRSSTLYT